MKARKTSLINVIDVVKLRVSLTANGGVSIDSTFFWFWTKNTAYTSGGTLRGDTLQASGVWVTVRDNWVPEVGGPAVTDFELPLDVHVGWPISGNQEKDSLHMKFWTPTSFADATYGNHKGVYWKWFKVRNGVQNSATVTHPNTIQAGYSASWDLVPDDDTLSYRVQWYWNGTVDSAFADKFTFTKTMPVAGTYTGRVDQVLYDTTYTFTWNVVVPLNLQLNGAPVVMPSETNPYSISVSGGTPPYSYAWQLDGNNFGTGSSVTTPAWNAYENHYLAVTVTDANSVVGDAAIIIFVNNGECDPQDPGCNVSLRFDSATPRAPAKLPAGRPPVQPRTPTVRRP
jgi:hypothetical protein